MNSFFIYILFCYELLCHEVVINLFGINVFVPSPPVIDLLSLSRIIVHFSVILVVLQVSFPNNAVDVRLFLVRSMDFLGLSVGYD